MARRFAFVCVLAACGAALVSAVPDYLFTPSTDPDPVGRATRLAIRQAFFGYADLAHSFDPNGVAFTNLPAGQYVKNVSVASSDPSAFIGKAWQDAQWNSLFDEVYMAEIPIGGQAGAAAASGLVLNTLADYASIYPFFGFTPIGLTGYATDEHFGRLRKTYFPTLIAKTTTLPSFLSGVVSPAAHAALVADALLGRLFQIDFAAAVAGLTLPDAASRFGNTLPSFALFRQAAPLSATSPLLPVGILLNGRWYVPTDPANDWTLAKLTCNMLEAWIQPLDHFIETHLMAAPAALAAQRQLDKAHPVRALLSEAIDYAVALAVVGFPGIFNIGTAYDAFSLFGSVAAHSYLNREWAARPFPERYFAANIASRGLTTLGGYAYRDDLQSYSSAFSGYVARTLGQYYASDAAVAADTELQAWAAEVASGSLGKIYGFPSPITSLDALEGVVNHYKLLVVRHHATNTRGYSEVELVVPYAPWRMNCTIPTAVGVVTETFIVQQCMPGLGAAVQQIAHARGFNRYFPPEYAVLYTPTTDETGKVNDLARTELAFRLNLLSSSIQSRPTTGLLPYFLLDPLLLPRSGFE